MIKNLSLEEEIVKFKIKPQNFIEKMKANDVETSSQIAHDSNLLVNENKELKFKVENLTKDVFLRKRVLDITRK